MTSVVHDESVLTDKEQAAWDELMDRVDVEYRYEMARAMFDDVRPEWEAHLAEAAPVPPPTAVDEERVRYEMAMALTDDVRPAWEAFLSDAAKKEARRDDPWADWDSA